MFAKFSKYVRPLALGLTLAAMGGSFALCTTPASVESRSTSVNSRAVGTNLHISNPFLASGLSSRFPLGGNVSADPQGFDLGDAVAGSQISRYLTALDGVVPYIFTADNTAGSFGLSLGSTGHLTGTFNYAGTSLPYFSATTLDAAGLTRTGLFFLNPNSGNKFHFSSDTLSDARVGQDYNANVEVANGLGSNVVYSVVSGSVELNGQSVANLESTGLKLFSDGIIAGRPFNSGTVKFKVQAVSNGTHAFNHAQTSADQSFSIRVLEINSVQSLLATLSATISVGGRRDGFQLSAAINTEGLSSSDFRNQSFVLRLGSQTFKTTLDRSGQSRSGDVRVRLNALQGQLDVQLRNQNLTKIFDNFPENRVTQNVIIQIAIGDDYLATEAIGFATRERRGQAKLDYRLGKNLQLGGLFQVLTVKGADYGNGTAFKIKFLISHVRGNSSTQFGTGQHATVHIGQGFDDDFSLFRGRAELSYPGVRSLKIDTHRKLGTLATYALPSSQTDVLPASQGEKQTLLFGLNLKTDTLDFLGESSTVLIPYSTHIN